ncbi:hypothetical protein HDE68_003135 [Pedobacter cryoconitis]|uniref:Lectin n=1 Tax=Pedobacter cryoconitis TaxID=188932 RepID=A0A7W9DZD6_9SPHI|nr:lectin [Pedobacter cryoconitis]MBB5637222.1 hypothetical protein [Pedobacter cryoconitis]
MKTITNVYLLASLCLLFSCAKQKLNAQSDNQQNTKLVQSSPAGDVVGKITVGYQGWFACIGDGSPINAWWHWAPNASQQPSSGNNGIKSWPDMREYTSSYQTGFSNLGNGQQARLFSSYSDQTIDIHFKWMEQNGIDAAALQRFNPNGWEGPIRDAVTSKVKIAAEAHNRKFYIMYDVSGWANMQPEIKADWTSKMSAYTSSPAYAKQNGKPVVCIWGFGFDDNNHPWSADVCLDVINWFKAKGCYVIGGVPTHWRDGNSDSRPNFLQAYKALNMISPWMVGRIGNVNDADNFYSNVNVPDQAFCNANGIDYQPCVLPGDLQERQRAHGDFMWRQFYNMIKAGCQGIYISMFDEYNEGNQIAKTAENTSMVPSGAGFLALDEDGVKCSADYYLRLTNDGGKMLKGQIPLTAVRPTEPVIGGGTIGGIPFDQTVSLKGSNNLFVSTGGSIQNMFCNRSAAAGTERFIVVNAGNGKVALKNGDKYVSSENGALPISCSRTAIGIWEQFDWVKNSNGTISLRGNNGKFISTENGTQAMTCNRDSAGIWEQFNFN